MQCYVCRAPVTDDQRFCEQCGQPFPARRPSDDVLAGFDLEAFNELRQEKARLRASLEALVVEGGPDGVSPANRGAWSELYERWAQVRDAITRAMDRFHPRGGDERRTGRDRRARPRVEDDRRQGVDRRDPFRARNPYRRRSPPADPTP